MTSPTARAGEQLAGVPQRMSHAICTPAREQPTLPALIVGDTGWGSGELAAIVRRHVRL